MDESIFELRDSNGETRGVLQVAPHYLWNDDTRQCDIPTYKTTITICGNICESDKNSLVVEISKIVKSFFM